MPDTEDDMEHRLDTVTNNVETTIETLDDVQPLTGASIRPPRSETILRNVHNDLLQARSNIDEAINHVETVYETRHGHPPHDPTDVDDRVRSLAGALGVDAVALQELLDLIRR